MDAITEKRLIKKTSEILREKRTSISDLVTEVPTFNYIDKDRQRAERALLFRKYPLAVTLSCRVANNGDYVTEDLAGMPIIVSRGEDGVVRTFLNACRHRGNVVCSEATGNKKRFVCGYHAWTYDTSGACKSFSDSAAFAGLDPDKHALIQLPTEERHGLVWTVPTPGASIDVAAYLGKELDEEMAGHELGSQVVFAEDTLRRPFNWKLSVDTFNEVYHVNILHKKTLQGLFTGLFDFEGLGQHHRFTAIRSSYPVNEAEQANMPSILPHTSIVYVLFPNTVVIWQMDHIEIWHIYPDPVRDDACVMRVFLVIANPPDERATRYWNRNWEILQQSVWKEDFDTMSDIQRNLGAGVLKNFVFGRNEAALQYFHQQVDKALLSDQSSR